MGEAVSPLLAVHPILAAAVCLCSLCRLISMYSSPCIVGWLLVGFLHVLHVYICVLSHPVANQQEDAVGSGAFDAGVKQLSGAHVLAQCRA
jgi:hypothetical protein